MLRPSYAELMDILNKEGENANVKSRYTIVIAAAKRARQLIDGHEPMIDEEKITVNKALSIAIEEMKEGKIEVVPEGQGTKLVLKKPEIEEESEESEDSFENEDDDLENGFDDDEFDEDDEFEADDEADAELFESIMGDLFPENTEENDADAEPEE